MRDDERMDGLIDAALRSYAEPGEIPEARVVLARVLLRAEEERRRLGWWMAAVGVAACAAAVVLVALVLLRGPRKAEIAWAPRAPGVVETVPQRLEPESSDGSYGTAKAVPLQNGAAARRGERVEAENRLPKLEVFPTPRPLTAEEQALVAFVTDTPVKVREQVVEAQKHLGDPIAIADLKIAPLKLDEKQDSNKER